MEPFTAFQKYIALKQHFTRDTYDYFKYGGKVLAKIGSFESRKDKYMFYRLSKKKDLEGYLVANFLQDNAKWVGNLLDSEADQIYTDWLKRQQSITYLLETDINNMDDDLNKNILVEKHEYPFLLKLFLRGEVNIESVIICNEILSFFKHWDKEIEDRVFWPELYRKFKKYTPFITFDKKRCTQILKNRFV